MAPRIPGRPLYRNPMSYLGLLVVLGAGLLIAAALIADFVFDQRNAYVGIITYLILPGVLLLGVLLILWGMRRESLRRRRATTSDAPPYPRVDLHDPVHRRRFVVAVFAGGALLLILIFAGIKGFAFTESVGFCGTTCHTVMEPEYTTYLSSPHARVPCVECHVGSGATWYVRSKLSGVRQVFAVMRDTYPRPIPTPIDNLRPARETCEHCHWPQKFFGSKLTQRPVFRTDEANTAEQISLTIKTGGGSPNLGSAAGIHWHMVVGNKVHYVPLDKRRQRIGTIRVERADGSKDEYFREDDPVPAKGAEPERLMDCVDCHNRPAHRFEAPDRAIDRALASGLISTKLPYVKKLATEALGRDYASREAAADAVRTTLTDFYRKRYPKVLEAQGNDLEVAIREIIAIYARNVFPAMKTSWKTHPDNLGHTSWRGCFRCHDGKHRTKSGKVLSRDCEVCHTMPQRGPLTPLGVTAVNTSDAWHPIELRGRHADLTCDRCHEVGVQPNEECRSCHEVPREKPHMDLLGCTDCHKDTGNPAALHDCRGCHASLKGVHARPENAAKACKSCHGPHTWKP